MNDEELEVLSIPESEILAPLKSKKPDRHLRGTPLACDGCHKPFGNIPIGKSAGTAYGRDGLDGVKRYFCKGCLRPK